MSATMILNKQFLIEVSLIIKKHPSIEHVHYGIKQSIPHPSEPKNMCGIGYFSIKRQFFFSVSLMLLRKRIASLHLHLIKKMDIFPLFRMHQQINQNNYYTVCSLLGGWVD